MRVADSAAGFGRSVEKFETGSYFLLRLLDPSTSISSEGTACSLRLSPRVAWASMMSCLGSCSPRLARVGSTLSPDGRSRPIRTHRSTARNSEVLYSVISTRRSQWIAALVATYTLYWYVIEMESSFPRHQPVGLGDNDNRLHSYD